MLKVIIAEDDSLTSFLLKKTLERIKSVQLIKEVDNGRELINAVNELSPDVLFIDIHMPQMSGLEAAREIYNIDPNIFIIFVTAYSNYALEAFDIYAFDYIVKPFNLKRIRKTVSRIERINSHNAASSDADKLIPIYTNDRDLKIFVQSKGNSTIVNTEDIFMITRIQRKTAIYTAKETVTTYENLETFEKKLGANFIRCHKGYVINLNMVKEIAPWGSKSYIVRFTVSEETALATLEKVRIIKEMLTARSLV
jgi:DNA-binding LytR/AlgR family response regulator